MVGIAFGTLISEVVCAFIAIVYLVKNKMWFTSNRLSFKELLFMSYDMFEIGFAQTTIQLLAGVSAFIVNYQLLFTGDRKSTRMNSSNVAISYAVFCLK